MAIFRFNELTYYSFGLWAASRNLRMNGLAIGLKKTIGKITQPINSYTRFPEYACFDAVIRDYLASTTSGNVNVLDVGSPKMFGLYLAFSSRAQVTLTDISELNVDEYQTIWRSVESNAVGKALFALEDARALRYEDARFDIVYSMSVIEHVDGPGGDAEAIREFIRVLKPGGLLLLSFPFGANYMEQQRIGFSGAVRATQDKESYFFQRIYNPAAVEDRILRHAVDLEQVAFTTISRKHTWMPRSFAALGENARGALGCLNPLLSATVNQSSMGMDCSFAAMYGKLHTARDIYGDLVMVARKRQA